jgi:hypothetical protein
MPSQAYMSMFRIAMNDGWTEVMYQAMDEVYDFGIFVLCLTALFFIFFHLLTNSVSDVLKGFCMRMNGLFFFGNEYHFLLV